MEQLLTQPELLARFVQVILTARSASSGPPVSVADPAKRPSPTAVQTTVHESITAPEHRGKAPSSFVETVVYAVAMRFQPDLGVIIRLYDFQFGMFRLSILHFAPFGVQQRMTWLNAGAASMHNFSAAETDPRPPVASSMGGLVDAAGMICPYEHEFFTQPLRDVLEALHGFAQQLDGWRTWTTPDLPHLVFWVNSVLEQFRSLVH
ncbi:unnamed protein product [Phytophthora fragariaefolia]|uniref:Unnamed protein product n=1 Tax=Phytophthora fragariaefolia TaxID=1490495 RepID=A0A9W6YPG0_9STRA|nr:unnamed protein product [Phytophthora fragariaefolia]